MADHRTGVGQLADGVPATDSHAPPTKPSSKRPSRAARRPTEKVPQKSLEECAALPLHVKPVLNGYAEVVAVGICSERSLRRHIATGRVKRSVLRNGRNLRFVTQILIDELRQAPE